MSDDRGLATRNSDGSHLAGCGKLPRDVDAEVGLHRIPIVGGVVIQEDVVAIRPEAGLRAKKCPDLIEGRPPDLPHATGSNLSTDRSQQSRRNHFDLNLWTHLLNLHFQFIPQLPQYHVVSGSQDDRTFL